jgi:hypothetical protein
MYCAELTIWSVEGLIAACSSSVASRRLVGWSVVWKSVATCCNLTVSGLQPAIDPDSAGLLVLYGLTL